MCTCLKWQKRFRFHCLDASVLHRNFPPLLHSQPCRCGREMHNVSVSVAPLCPSPIWKWNKIKEDRDRRMSCSPPLLCSSCIASMAYRRGWFESQFIRHYLLSYNTKKGTNEATAGTESKGKDDGIWSEKGYEDRNEAHVSGQPRVFMWCSLIYIYIYIWDGLPPFNQFWVIQNLDPVVHGWEPLRIDRGIIRLWCERWQVIAWLRLPSSLSRCMRPQRWRHQSQGCRRGSLRTRWESKGQFLPAHFI